MQNTNVSRLFADSVVLGALGWPSMQLVAGSSPAGEFSALLGGQFQAGPKFTQLRLALRASALWG